MPIDPQCKKILEIMAAAGGPPMEQQTHLELRAGRAAAAEASAALAGPEAPMAHVEDRLIPGPASEIPIRLYYPSLDRPLPIVVYYHGGGWVIGSIADWDRTCRSLAAASGCIVASVDYRLAPEHKFPAPADDSYTAFHWVATHAAEVGADPARIAVAGDSAGANLATAVCLMARDKKAHQPAFQLLVYPVVDVDDASPSMSENAEGYFLTRAGMRKFWDFYLASPADGQSPYASPAKANVAGLPPAFVITAEYDPLRDQGEAYAAKLKSAGVPSECKRYAGAIHAFFSFAGVVDSGKQAMSDAGAALRQALKT